MPRVADFLGHLWHDEGLSLPTVKGYRSALSSVYRQKGLDITTDQDLRDIVRGFANQVPRRTFSCPNWDLDIVLKALTQEPFEPLAQASFKRLSQKTIFLLSLATAKRVGEIQGLSHRVAYRQEDMILSYLPNFFPKTDTAEMPLPREFKLKSLSSILGRDMIERTLCPVRALHFYLDRTKGVSPRPGNLFLAIKNDHLAMKKNAISYYLREVIRYAHRTQPEATYPVGDIRAHSIRAVATSMSFRKNRSFASVLEAATWRGNSIFVSHYLKDVQRTYEHCSALGPIVAAGEVL